MPSSRLLKKLKELKTYGWNIAVIENTETEVKLVLTFRGESFVIYQFYPDLNLRNWIKAEFEADLDGLGALFG